MSSISNVLATLLVSASSLPLGAATAPAEGDARADVIIRGGHIYDGGGGAPYVADVALEAGRITAIGDLAGVKAARSIDARGLAVSPGFIDSVSVSYEFYPLDRRSLSKVYQGVTLEALGEGEAPAPLSDAMKKAMKARQYQFEFDVPWSTVGEYIRHLDARGVGTNYAVYVGASNVRSYVIGESSRAPTAPELQQMARLVRDGMREGAVGLTAGLSWTPGAFATREELLALSRVVSEFDGLLEIVPREESNGAPEAVEEIIGIARVTGARAEMPMFKQSGQRNWGDYDRIIGSIEAARTQGVRIMANMYPYTWLGTSLSTSLPPWVRAGTWEELLVKLEDPVSRARIVREMREWQGGWEQLVALAGTPENVAFTKLERPLTSYQGRTLADVMRDRGLSAEEAVVAMIRESRKEVWGVYQTMSETNVRRQMGLPWMGFASGDMAAAAEGAFLKTLAHPRAYGYVARLLGKYVRDDHVLTLQEAIRRLTSLPAQNLKLPDRGRLAPGCAADVVVFDPAKVRDVATFQAPHRYSEGFHHVFVNGVAVIDSGRHTGALPGRAVTPENSKGKCP
jgi:N-acyl-D-amino-acid deacylase